MATSAHLVRIRVEIHIARSDSDMQALLDMLRYEGGRVVAWDRVDSGTFLITIEVEAVRYVPRRWRSFGIHPQEV